MSSHGSQYPSHLRPVADSGDSTAPLLIGPEEDDTPGLTPPVNRGHSRGFTTDVLVELGYATPDRVEAAIEAARTAGRAPEALLLEQGAINGDQLSRAIAERYGLDHLDLSVFQSTLQPPHSFRSPWPVATKPFRSATPISRHSLVAAADPANVLAVDDIQIATGLDCRIAVAAEEDVEALLATARHAAERRRRGDHRRRGRGG